MNSRLQGVAALLGALIAIPHARADIIYQSIPDITVTPYNAFCSTCNDRGGATYQVFDTFILGSNSTVGSVTFDLYGGSDYFPANTQVSLSGVQVSIWTANAGQPGSQLFSQTFTPGQYSFVYVPSIAIVTVNPTGLSLEAGKYYISFSNPINLGVSVFSHAGGEAYLMDSSRPGQNGFSAYQFSAGFILENSPSAGFIIPMPPISNVPGPIVGAGLPGVVMACGIGLLAWRRKRKWPRSLT